MQESCFYTCFALVWQVRASHTLHPSPDTSLAAVVSSSSCPLVLQDDPSLEVNDYMDLGDYPFMQVRPFEPLVAPVVWSCMLPRRPSSVLMIHAIPARPIQSRIVGHRVVASGLEKKGRGVADLCVPVCAGGGEAQDGAGGVRRQEGQVNRHHIGILFL